MTCAFPILRLPANAQTESLRYLDFQNLLNFALVSKSAQQAARMLNYKGTVVVTLDQNILLRALVTSMQTVLRKNRKISHTPEIFTNNFQLTIRHWINTSLSIFSSYTLFCRIKKLHYNFKKLYTELDGLFFFRVDLSLKHLPALNPEMQAWLWKFVQKYSNNGLTIYTTVNLPSRNLYHQILAPFRRILQIEVPCTTSDLLAMNCTAILLFEPISAVDFNLFLRHWIKGANQVVKSLNVEIEDAHELTDLIFKDIKCWDRPQKTAKKRRRSRIIKDIYSCAGVRATLMIRDYSVKMCVWK